MVERINKFSSVMEKITKGCCYISFIGVIVLMMLNVFDVIFGKLFNSPIIGAYELTQRILMCTVFASFAYAQSKKTHINMTILVVHFPRVVRFALFTLMCILSVLAAGALTYAAFVQMGVSISDNVLTEVLYIPIWPFFLVEGLTMAVFTVSLIYDAVLSAISIAREDVAELVMKDWN